MDTDNKKKFSYRYNYYDRHGKRREKSKIGFESATAAERALTANNILNGGEKIAYNENMTVSHWGDIYIEQKSQS